MMIRLVGSRWKAESEHAMQVVRSLGFFVAENLVQHIDAVAAHSGSIRVTHVRPAQETDQRLWRMLVQEVRRGHDKWDEGAGTVSGKPGPDSGV